MHGLRFKSYTIVIQRKYLSLVNQKLIYFKTIYKLGFINLLRVLWYRIISSHWIGEQLFPSKKIKVKSSGYFPSQPDSNINKIAFEDMDLILLEAEKILQNGILSYSYTRTDKDGIPNWFINPFNGESYPSVMDHWTKLSDFNAAIGDIKNIWEASRFNWLVVLAAAYTINHKETYISTINLWLRDWEYKNPINIGPNWRCGQEASIRAINTLLAIEIINDDLASAQLMRFLKQHITRILPTTAYAKSQDNNHGVSEGVALFLIGHFLFSHTKEKKYLSIAKKGRKLLEDRIHRLILADGSFSQHSIVYHRMVLDLLSIVEIFRENWKLVPFTKSYYIRIEVAVQWLSVFIDNISGNAPNLGANDGTYLFNINGAGYRDFRPSLSLAASVFKTSVSAELITKHPFLDIFNIPLSDGHYISLKSTALKEGGYVNLSRKNGFAYLRLPIYKFRPSHSDALHVDIWQDGVNWIRDAGSYSYALPLSEQEKYSGTAGHSTIQFDGRNQMPRISRFLFGDWLEPSYMEFSLEENYIESSYVDYLGAKHYRKLLKVSDGWKIIDKISGQFKTAVQRWLLAPGEWFMEGNKAKHKNVSVMIQSENINRFELKTGEESLFYMNRSSIPVLEVEYSKACTIETKILFFA
jgi:hypothetical protein